MCLCGVSESSISVGVGLPINVQKGACMAIRTSSKETLPVNLFIRGVSVPQVSTHKHLGVVIDEELSFEALCKKVTQSARFDQMTINNLLAPTVQAQEARKVLFDAHVKSRTAYGNEV